MAVIGAAITTLELFPDTEIDTHPVPLVLQLKGNAEHDFTTEEAEAAAVPGPPPAPDTVMDTHPTPVDACAVAAELLTTAKG